MGLDKAKSLLEVTGGNTFLDLIAKQVGSFCLSPVATIA